ncbi:MAG: hypothetical protein LCH88_19970 [Proteobacteria bacterium]|nr:hypothetical protein [Pseudomonadota bacterium]
MSAEKPPPIVRYERRRDAKGRVETTFAVSLSQRVGLAAILGTSAALADGGTAVRGLLSLLK